MRCYYVFVHGSLSWVSPPVRCAAGTLPKGFYCFRWVLASTEEEAASRAFKRVEANLDNRTGWLTGGNAVLTLDVDEIRKAPLYKLLKRENRAHVFYEEED